MCTGPYYGVVVLLLLGLYSITVYITRSIHHKDWTMYRKSYLTIGIILLILAAFFGYFGFLC